MFMKLTSKGRYAVNSMLDVSLHSQTWAGVLAWRYLSDKKFSLSYLEQIIFQDYVEH